MLCLYKKTEIKRFIMLFLSVPLIAIGLYSCDKGASDATQTNDVAQDGQVPAYSGLVQDKSVNKTWPEVAENSYIRYYNKLDANSSWVDLKGYGEDIEGIRSVALNSDASKLYVPTANGIFVVDVNEGGAELFVSSEVVKASHGIVVAPNGDVLIVDKVSQSVKVFSSEGTLITEFGSFTNPAAIAMDQNSERLTVYVVDTNTNEVSAWKLVGDQYTHQHNLTGGDMVLPVAVAVNSQGNVYVANWGKPKIQIYSPEGAYISGFGNKGTWPGQFINPKGIAIDSDDNVYVTDVAFDNIQIFTADGRLCMYFGEAGTGIGKFNLPSQIAIDNQDRIFVAEYGAHRIQIFQYVSGI